MGENLQSAIKKFEFDMIMKRFKVCTAFGFRNTIMFPNSPKIRKVAKEAGFSFDDCDYDSINYLNFYVAFNVEKRSCVGFVNPNSVNTRHLKEFCNPIPDYILEAFL